MLTYGSSFWSTTFSPREAKRRPREAVVMPLPSPEATPPVTKMNFVCSFTTGIDCSRRDRRAVAIGLGSSSSTGRFRGDPASRHGRAHVRGLHEQLLGVRDRVLRGLEAGEHPRELPDAPVVVEHLYQGRSTLLPY